MSASPSRWPRHAAPSTPHSGFAPTMPLELDALGRPGGEAQRQEVWHDTHPGGDEFDTVPGAIPTPPAAAVRAAASAARGTPAASAASTDSAAHASSASIAGARSAADAPQPATRPLDPADPALGHFHEALGGLQVRELVNEELFQRLFGPVG